MLSYNILDKINDLIETGVPVDVLALKRTLQIIETVTNLLLGVVVWGIFVLLIMVTALDVCYMTIPIFKNKMSTIGWDKAGGFRIISIDAQKAVEELYLFGKLALAVYLKRRTTSYIVIGVVVTFLLSGGWEMMMNINKMMSEGIVIWLYGL